MHTTRPAPASLQPAIPRRLLIRQVFRAGGPGGQHQNKTETGVRFIHIPTGIRAEARSERSQHANAALALRLLMARLAERLRTADATLRAAAYHAKPDPCGGSQRRSYFLDSDRRVIDHQTGASSGQPHAVLAGELDEFLAADLRSRIA